MILHDLIKLGEAFPNIICQLAEFKDMHVNHCQY